MDDSSIGVLFGAIAILVILSAYFSGSETAMMALNRYRLRHLANQGHGGALRASKLLERPDRLLGVILIGNNFVNFSAASIATVIALRLFGESGVALAPIICTFVFLIFAEVAPKTISAAYPERVALTSAYVLQVLLWVTYPLVVLVNWITNSFLRIAGLQAEGSGTDNLSTEELRTVVYEGSKIAKRPQNMLLGILDLDKVTVNDIMIPRHEVDGIDLDDDIDHIIQQLRSSQHTRLPIFRTDIDQVVGVLHLRNASRLLLEDEITLDAILDQTQDPYFTPESTPLHTQLLNFQQSRQRIGLVVDEYGDVLGIVTLEDILEEIVGEFTTDVADASVDIHPQPDGSFFIDGSAQVRIINRNLGWDLPIDGPKTLNGLITEYLEMIPDSHLCISLPGYHIEIIQLKDNMIRTAKVDRVAEAVDDTKANSVKGPDLPD